MSGYDMSRLNYNPLATQLLSGALGDGDTIRVDAENHRFTFEKIPEGPA